MFDQHSSYLHRAVVIVLGLIVSTVFAPRPTPRSAWASPPCAWNCAWRPARNTPIP